MEECRCPKCGNIVTCLEGPPPGVLRCASCGAFTEVPADAPLIGRVIGGHHIIRKIGAGGIGTVYLATQLSLRRRVAFKALKSDLVNDPQALELFRNEAISAARLNHPNVVHIHDIATDQGITYLTMEFVNGVSLRQLIASEGPMNVATAIGLAKQVLLALAEAHRRHVVHRDVKPENVLIGDDGLAKVADFGLAGVLIRGDRIDHLDMGTPRYMSPEHARGEPLDPRADIYSVGATLYHMLTGKPPYQGETVREILDHLKAAPPAPVTALSATVPAALAAIVEKMMARERSGRYQAAEEVLKDLEAFSGSAGREVASAFLGGRNGALRSAAVAQMTREGMDVARGERRRRHNGTLFFLVPSIVLALAGMVFLLVSSPGHRGARTMAVRKGDVKALARAALLYDSAMLFADDHPDDYAAVIYRLEEVARQTAGTPYQMKALHQLGSKRRSLDEKAKPVFKTVRIQADECASRGRYRDAQRVFDSFPAEFMDSTWRDVIARTEATYRTAATQRMKELRGQAQQALAESRYEDAIALYKEMEQIGYHDAVREAQANLTRIGKLRQGSATK